LFDWITGLVQQMGYLGVALLMFLENVFPPIPSELIMPLAGFNAAQGQMSIWLVILAGTIGSLAGAYLWYVLGRRLGMQRLCRLADRHGRWLTMSRRDVDQARDWFDRRGGVAVLIGRLVPAIRTLISVPAGIARMPVWAFLAYSAVGTLLWTAFLAGAGYLLQSQYDRVEAWLNPISNIIVAAVVLYYLYRVITWPRPSGGEDEQDAPAKVAAPGPAGTRSPP
jgi:membrane protein DedA with SNARE-associated domain